MAFDETFKLVDAALNTAPNTNVYPNANLNGFATGSNSISLGRRGFPRGSEFVVIVEGLASTGSTGTNLTCVLQLSLDNGTTWRPIASVEVGDPDNVFHGQVAARIDRDISGQEYANANVDVRMQVVPIGTNTSNNTTASKIAAFIAVGETTKFGRKSTADTLFV